VYVWVGSTNRQADRDLVEELRLFGRGEALDATDTGPRLGSAGLLLTITRKRGIRDRAHAEVGCAGEVS
jgi:hypothetical protein